MKEELQIKVKVDTSNITTTLNKLKNEVSNVEKSMEGTSSSSSSIAKNTKEATQAQTKLTEKVSQMIAKVKGVKGMGFTDMAVAIYGANKGLEATKKKLREVQQEAVKPSTVIRSKMFEAIQGSIEKLRSGGAQGQGFTVISPEANAQIQKLHGLTEKLFSEDKLTGFFKLKKEMKALGVSTKGTGFTLKNLGAALTTAGAAATAAAAAIAVFVAALVAVAAGVAKAIQVSKVGDEIYHLAHRFNMGTEAFQEWSYVMEQAGGSIDDLEGFMETLASEQAAVIEGSEGAIENFKRLGLSAEEVSGMRQQELFEETVKRIQQIGDETQRSAIAYSIFGDEASKFMNVLNMSNAEMGEMVNNYHLLGGAMSGELLESSNKLQGSIHNLKQAWSGIGNAIAQVFMPIAQKLVDWLTKALVVVQLFVKTIFGLDLRSTGAGDAMDSAAGSTNKYAKSAKSATKAAEELKRVTMGFDELNIVSNPNKGSGDSDSSSSPSMGGLGDIGAALPDMSNLGLDGIYAWFEEYKGVIAQITTWSLLLIGIIMAVIGCMTVNIPLAAAGFALAGLGITIGIKSGAFAAAWEAVKKVALAAWDWIKGIPGWFWEDICVPIGNFFVELGTAIWDGVVAGWNAIINFITSIPGWIYDKILVPIGNFFVNLYNSIVNGVKNAWNGIINVLKTVGSWISDNIITPVGKFFSNMWNGFKSGASQAWEGIKSVFSAVTGWFKDVFTKAWTGVKNVFSTGGKIFDGIKDGIASVFKTVVNGIIGGINKVIAVPFNAINALLNKIRDVSVAGIEPFKGLIKYNALSVPQIPQLAKGGIATASTIANIGEAGKEAILPLENNTEWMDTLANKIAERNSTPSKIVLQVGEKELGWATINSINGITKQTGSIQLAL